jgi:hypothetical protein
MLVSVPQLYSGKENRPVAGSGGIAPSAADGTIEGAVVGDVCGVKTGARVPLPVSLGVESGATIMRSFRVTVKVDCQEITIGNGE